jgi:hypothetical protein
MQWFFKMRRKANFPVLFFGYSDCGVPAVFQLGVMPMHWPERFGGIVPAGTTLVFPSGRGRIWGRSAAR